MYKLYKKIIGEQKFLSKIFSKKSALYMNIQDITKGIKHYPNEKYPRTPIKENTQGLSRTFFYDTTCGEKLSHQFLYTYQVYIPTARNKTLLSSFILRPDKNNINTQEIGKTLLKIKPLHYYPSLPLFFPLPMESCSFRPATAPSPFPSAPSSSSSSPRAPCPHLRFPVSASLLRSYCPNFSFALS